MGEPKRSWLKRIDPRRLADAADNRFVGLARMIAGLAGLGRGGTRPARSGTPVDHPASCGAGRCEHGGECAARGAAPNGMTARLSRQMLKELFDRDPARRKSAARWFRDRRIEDARPAIEGSLAVEEDAGVRRELIKTLRAIELERRPDQGGL